MTNHPVIRWNIGNSPHITLGLLGIDDSQIKHEDKPHAVRVELAKREDFDIQGLAHTVATQRSHKCGESFDDVYRTTLDFYRRERELALHPQFV